MRHLRFALLLSLTLLGPHKRVEAKDEALPTGEVEIVNNYDADFTIHLRHADAPGHRFGSWRVSGLTRRTRLVNKDERNIVIGGDWEVEIEFGNGIVSPRRVVAQVGTHANATWTMTGGDIFDGLQRSAARWAVPVLVIRYFPVADNGRDLNLEVTAGPAHESSLTRMKEKCNRMTEETARALEEGSRFRAYRFPYAPPSLRYEIVDTIDYLEAVPLDPRKKNCSDYHSILARAGVRDYVEAKGIKEIWIWGYHTDTSGLWESNMSSPHGVDVSNSDRDRDDLPIYKTTFTVYHYNYHRDTKEAIHDHLHQIECLIRDSHPTLARRFEGEEGRWRCGNCHFPPNGERNYDYHNPRSVESDIEDWKPEGSGARKLINRDVWNDDEVGYYVYWMRSLPGERNGLNYEGRAR